MDICRVCLSLSPEKDINDLQPTKSQEPESSTEIFQFCLNIPVTEDTKITTKLCTKCYQNILTFYKFKVLALKSDEYLRSNASNTINDPVKYKDIIAVSNSGFNDNDTGDDFNNLVFNIDNKDELRIKAECLESDGSDDEAFNLFEAKTEIEDSVVYRPGGCDTVHSATNSVDTLQTVNIEEKGAPSPKKLKLDDNQPTAARPDVKVESDFSIPKIINTKDKSEEDVTYIFRNESNKTKEEIDNRKGKEHITETIKFNITHKMSHTNMPEQKPAVTKSNKQSNKTSCTTKKRPNSSNNSSFLHTNGSILICDICGYNTDGIKSLNLHLKAHAAKKRYSCNSCLYIATNLKRLTKHIVTHTGEKPHSCNVCDKKFSRKQHLHRHVKTHTGEKPHSCYTCDKKFSDRANLNRHVRAHTGEKPHSCSICGKAFTSKGDLKRHVKVHSGEKPYSCNTCDKKFSEKMHLDRHVRMVHEGEKPYSCNICGKKFCINESLKKHVRVHTGEKPHSCNICDKKFSNKADVTRHVRLHTGEKPHSCNTCDKKFSYRASVDRHVKLIHTGEKPHSCSTCDMTFTYKRHLNRHLRVHTGE